MLTQCRRPADAHAGAVATVIVDLTENRKAGRTIRMMSGKRR